MGHRPAIDQDPREDELRREGSGRVPGSHPVRGHDAHLVRSQLNGSTAHPALAEPRIARYPTPPQDAVPLHARAVALSSLSPMTRPHRVRSRILSLVLLSFLSVAPGAVQDLELRFLSVGQGDAILVRNAGRAALIDAGPSDRIAERLHTLGVSSLDLLIASHNHADHIGGAFHISRNGYSRGVPVRPFLAGSRAACTISPPCASVRSVG